MKLRNIFIETVRGTVSRFNYRSSSTLGKKVGRVDKSARREHSCSDTVLEVVSPSPFWGKVSRFRDNNHNRGSVSSYFLLSRAHSRVSHGNPPFFLSFPSVREWRKLDGVRWSFHVRVGYDARAIRSARDRVRNGVTIKRLANTRCSGATGIAMTK